MKENRKVCEIFTHDKIDSTNNEVERLLANGEKTPLQCLRINKNKGRGRFGRHGIVQKVETFISFGFRPNVQAIRIETLLWRGLNICNF